MMRNKTVTVLVGILVVLLVIGGFRNLRTGIVVGDQFLYERSPEYFKAGDDEIRVIKGDGFTNFEIILDGEARRAALSWSRRSGAFGAEIEHDYATLTFDDGTVVEGFWFANDMLIDKDGRPISWTNLGEMIVVDDTVRVISNEALSQDLCQIDRGEMVKNGHIAMVLVGALIYVIGAVTFLFPEKMYFLGSRWRYKNAELSDDGIMMQQFGAVICMIMGAVLIVNLAGLR